MSVRCCNLLVCGDLRRFNCLCQNISVETCFTVGSSSHRIRLAQHLLQSMYGGAGGSGAGLTSLSTSGRNPSCIVRCASQWYEQTRVKDFILPNKLFAQLGIKQQLHIAEYPQTSGYEEFGFQRKL